MTSDPGTFPAPCDDGAVESQGPIGRVAVVSVAVGAAGALVLTGISFAGGTESIMLGSVLTSFGLGWATLERLSLRCTAAPQTWARVPALGMTVTGLALLVLRPGASAMTTLNWVWPLPVLVLAAWMHQQQRAVAPRHARRVLTPVTAALVLASLGAAYQDAASLRPTSRPPGHVYEIDGRLLHLDCRGDGSPTTLLFNGLGESSASWAWISDDVRRVGRVCGFDRAGQGWSDAASEPQDARAAARDLHALLAAASVQGPYVLAGHSTGGPFAMTYAAIYPGDVAGMVLVDSSSPDQFSLPDYPDQYAVMRRLVALAPTVWRLGGGHLGPALAPSRLPAPAAAQVDALSASPRYVRNQRDELSVLPQVFAQARALSGLGATPLVVLTASGSATDIEGWVEAQDALASLSTDHVQRLIASSHAGMLEDEVAAGEVAHAISEVVSAARASRRLGSN